MGLPQQEGRHSYGNEAGVHTRIAGERLGGTAIGVPLGLYSRAAPGKQADAAEQVDAAICSAVKAKP